MAGDEVNLYFTTIAAFLSDTAQKRTYGFVSPSR